MTTSSTRLEMRNISINFAGFQALNLVDFTLEAGSIHALIGANGAGKSTLMAILAGTWQHYQGTILLAGQPVNIHSVSQARQWGIHLVQQEVDVALVPTLTVGENIMLDSLAQPGQWCNWSQLYPRARQLLDQLQANIDVRQPVSRCSLAEKQQILLARALSHHCRYLILDEPTAPLDQAESARLFSVVRRLRDEGIGVVFISHRIHELAAVCDHLTVLRDGQQVGSGPMAGINSDGIIEKMLGHRLDDIFPPPRTVVSDELLLQVEGLQDDALLDDISFTLRKGEILGIAGLAGAGKTELCKALFGASRAQLRRGQLAGQAWQPVSPYRSVQQGLVLVPEERRREGIFLDENIAMNLSVAADNSFSWAGFFSRRQAWLWAGQMVARLGIRASGLNQTLRRLSGGNQQKVSIGKWLRCPSRVLIFDEPTKGVDIKAKQDLYALIDDLARQGKGIIYASGEFAELLGLCDRICVLWDGRIVAQLEVAGLSEETLLHYSTGGTSA